jgi:hypothetical protein
LKKQKTKSLSVKKDSMAAKKRGRGEWTEMVTIEVFAFQAAEERGAACCVL